MKVTTTIAVRFKSLTMRDEDWFVLSKTVDGPVYHEMVMDYQAREDAKRPLCHSVWGLCRYWDRGRCWKRGKCSDKIPA
jgi:hypothetical protein